MQFQSIEFVLFLAVVFAVYWAIPNKYRWILLLVSGYFFYASWNPKYLFILAGITLTTFFVGRLIEESKESRKKFWLLTFVIGEVSVLFLFKYLNFFISIVSDVGMLFGTISPNITINLLLPIGISFYIFQTLGYILDIYYERMKAEKDLGHFAVCVAFFPIMLAGPIERIPKLICEIKKEKRFSYCEASVGFQRILTGVMKKVIIADGIASVFVDQVHLQPDMYFGFALFLSILLYSIEIYCDFSGYSDIAIGVSNLFNISIGENFRQPYFSDSITDFWRRWHISLTSWFRDYVYIPLGGNRVSKAKKWRNIICVYLLSGLWHGANWTFVIWGVLNGLVQIVEKGMKNMMHTVRIPRSVKLIYTYFLISVLWVFFRAESIRSALLIIGHCLDGIRKFPIYLRTGIALLNVSMIQVGFLGFFGLVLLILDIRSEQGRRAILPSYILIFLVTLGLTYFFKYGIDNRSFIYFQF